MKHSYVELSRNMGKRASMRVRANELHDQSMEKVFLASVAKDKGRHEEFKLLSKDALNIERMAIEIFNHSLSSGEKHTRNLTWYLMNKSAVWTAIDCKNESLAVEHRINMCRGYGENKFPQYLSNDLNEIDDAITKMRGHD